ncbi:putative RiPP precursor [Mesorhizobium sp. PL10]
MKKTYSKPVLVKKGKLSQITANGASSITPG